MGNHITDMVMWLASSRLCRRGVTASVVSIVSIVPAFADISAVGGPCRNRNHFPCALVA
jgi:hypothetical protein